MQTIFTNIKYCEIILSNANENWYIILYDLFSRLWYIATCGPFRKDATHIRFSLYEGFFHRVRDFCSFFLYVGLFWACPPPLRKFLPVSMHIQKKQ